MKLDFRALRTAGAALLLGALSLGAVGCGDDEPTTPPTPRYAPITAFNGVVDLGSSALQFKIGDQIVAGNVAFGNPTTVSQALVGTGTKVEVLTPSGTALSSATVAIDTGRSVWVIAAGEAVGGKSPTIFGISHEEPTAPAGRALVRMIHASHDLGKVDVHESDAFGPMVASNLDFKQASSFTSISPSVTQLSVTGAGNNTEVFSINVSPRLDSGKVYNIVLFGTTNQSAQTSVKVQGKIVPEP